MPIYEYVAKECRGNPACALRKEYIQAVTAAALTECRDCGAPIRRVLSSFAARSGRVGVSSPDPTGLNIGGIPAPTDFSGSPGEEGGCAHDHDS